MKYQSKNSMEMLHLRVLYRENFRYDMAFHRDCEFIYVVEGELKMRTLRGIETAGPGDGIFIESHQLHEPFSPGPTKLYIVVFSTDHVRAFEKKCKGTIGESAVFHMDEKILPLLYSFLFHNTSDDLLMRKCCLYALCWNYYDAVPRVHAVRSSDMLIQKITDYVHENYHEDISIKRIAETFGYDSNYLSSVFNTTTGISFRNFLNWYRIEEACSLITGADRKLIDIAHAVGFQSVRTFNRAFMAFKHQTPSEFRADSQIPVRAVVVS